MCMSLTYIKYNMSIYMLNILKLVPVQWWVGLKLPPEMAQLWVLTLSRTLNSSLWRKQTPSSRNHFFQSENGTGKVIMTVTEHFLIPVLCSRLVSFWERWSDGKQRTKPRKGPFGVMLLCGLSQAKSFPRCLTSMALSHGDPFSQLFFSFSMILTKVLRKRSFVDGNSALFM